MKELVVREIIWSTVKV